MTDILKELETAKKKLQELERERNKVEGMHAQLLDQLKAKGFNTLEEGKAEVVRLTELRAQQEQEAVVLLAEFKEKYKLFL